MSRRHVAPEAGRLLDLLARAFPESPRTRLKQSLQHGAVTVNGEPVTRHDHEVARGDEIVLHPAPPLKLRHRPATVRFPILHEDEHLLVIDKPVGLLAIASEREKVRTAYHQLTDYVRVRTRNPHARIFVVHRLDRETSGLMLFAKTDTAKEALQKGWEQVEKRYYAVVSGRPEEPAGVIRSRLVEDDDTMRVYSTKSGSADSRPAITRWQLVRSVGKYSLLELDLVTGRKNQIRVHCAELGHPIVGDRKYGSTVDPAGRLALHAFYLSFDHPATGERMAFTRPLPRLLDALVTPRKRGADRRSGPGRKGGASHGGRGGGADEGGEGPRSRHGGAKP